MEQTVHISLAGVQFSLEESAFRRLRAYLDSLEAHFAHDADRSEIVRDIEARIAEKLTNRGVAIVGEHLIASIIAEIGNAEDLGGEHDEAAPSHGPRRLYRDPDDCIVAGVASGIAAYFGIDPIIPRLLFLLSIFAGGTGIILYAVLWVILPPAENTSQKLEMRGHPVTLEKVRDMVKERITETKHHGSLRRLLRFPIEVIRACTRMLPIIGRIIGVCIALGSFAAILGLTIAATLGATNYDAAYIDFPIRDAISPLLFFATIAAGYLAATIPFVLILLFGVRLVRRDASAPAAVGFGLIGIWSLAVITFVALTVRVTGQYAVFMETDPRFATTEQVVPLGTLTGIETRGVDVTIEHGSAYAMRVEGSVRQIATLNATTSGSVLVLERQHDDRPCIFCDMRPMPVTVTVPSIRVIGADDAHVQLDDLSADALTFRTEGARVSGTLEAGSVAIDAIRSSFELRGRMQSLRASLDDSNLDAHRAPVIDADVAATQWSSASIDVSRSLKSAADETSTIIYVGSPRTLSGPATTTVAR